MFPRVNLNISFLYIYFSIQIFHFLIFFPGKISWVKTIFNKAKSFAKSPPFLGLDQPLTLNVPYFLASEKDKFIAILPNLNSDLHVHILYYITYLGGLMVLWFSNNSNMPFTMGKDLVEGVITGQPHHSQKRYLQDALFAE